MPSKTSPPETLMLDIRELDLLLRQTIHLHKFVYRVTYVTPRPSPVSVMRETKFFAKFGTKRSAIWRPFAPRGFRAPTYVFKP